jgi:hypothetical protein
MRALKQGVDPNGIMNPGTLLPPPTQLPIEAKSTIDLQSLKEHVISFQDWDNLVVEKVASSEPDVIPPAAPAAVQKTENGSWYSGIFGGSKKPIAEEKPRETQVESEGKVE